MEEYPSSSKEAHVEQVCVESMIDSLHAIFINILKSTKTWLLLEDSLRERLSLFLQFPEVLRYMGEICMIVY
jgi:hypothetical protein